MSGDAENNSRSAEPFVELDGLEILVGVPEIEFVQRVSSVCLAKEKVSSRLIYDLVHAAFADYGERKLLLLPSELNICLPSTPQIGTR